MTNTQRESITSHGFILHRLFIKDGIAQPLTLSKSLRRIETRLHRLAEDLCNGVKELTDKQFEAMEKRELARVTALLPYLPESAIVINTDPRGYALKISTEYMKANDLDDIERDWGGYGILAPDIN